MKYPIQRFWRCLLTLAIAVLVATAFLFAPLKPLWAQSAGAEVLDQLVTIGYPGAYSEYLSYYVEKSKDSVDEATKLIHGDLTKYNQYISRVVAVTDVLNKAGQGQMTDATLSAALAGISELVGTEQGKAFLKLHNIAPPMVTALITAVQVAWESKKAVDASTVGLKLEILYGSIEFDPVLKSKDRELGQGNPIPVTPQAVDHVWKKVITNDRFRDLFRVYYTEEQGKTWPQTSFWEYLSMSLDSTTDKNVMAQADTAKLYENRDEIKREISGLLAWLNKIRKKEELAVIARKEIIALQAKTGEVDFATALEKYSKAVAMMPVVERYTAKCKQDIEEAKKNEKQTDLSAFMSLSKEYAGNVLKYIPDKGQYGSARQRLLDGLKICYREAQTVYDQVTAKYKEKLLKEAQEGRKDETTPQQTAQAPSQKAPDAKIVFQVVRYPFDLKPDQINDEAARNFLSSGSLEKTEKSVIDKYTRDSKEKYGADKTKLAAEVTRLRGALERDIQTRQQRVKDLAQQSQALSGNPDPNTQRQRGKLEQEQWGLESEIESLRTSIGNLEKEHKLVLSKIEAYEKLDEMAYLELRDRLNQLKESYAASAERNRRTMSSGGDGIAGMTRLQTDIGMLKKEYVEAVEGAMYNVGRIPEPQPAGLPKLLFQKSTISFDGYNPALTYIGPYYDYVDGLLTSAKAQPGVTGNYPVETALKELDSALGFLLAFQQRGTQIQEIESSIVKTRQFYETSFLGVDKTTQNPLGSALIALESEMRGLREFQKKTEGWRTSVKEKKELIIGLASGAEDGTGYLRSLKTILAKAIQTLGKPAAIHKRLGVANYQIGSTSGDIFFLKEGASGACENLQKGQTILTNADVERVKQATISELMAIPGLTRIDAAYGLGMEQFARQYLDFFFKGAYGPEHYVFLSVDRCLFFTKEHFDGLTVKIEAIPKEQMIHEHVLMAEMIRIVGDQNLALQMGVKRIGAESAKTTAALVGLAAPNWDGDTKQAIARFAASVEAKYQMVKGGAGSQPGAPQMAQPISGPSTASPQQGPSAPPSQTPPLLQNPPQARASAEVSPETPNNAQVEPAGQVPETPRPAVPSTESPELAAEPSRAAVTPKSKSEGTRAVPAEVASKIKELYAGLKEGLESESPGEVIRCLGRGWTGTGGMDQGDLRKALTHAFRDLQDPRCTIQGLRVERIDDDSYKVIYDFTLTSKTKKTKEMVEQKSAVTDEVGIEKSGKPKITRTVSGRFWPQRQ